MRSRRIDQMAWKPVGAVAGLAALAWMLLGGAASDAPASLARDGRWTPVAPADVVQWVPMQGSLGAVHSNEMGPPAVPGVWEFSIARLTPEGREVERGEPILSFDTSVLDKRLDERRAELASVREELEKKRTSIEARRRDDELKMLEATSKREKTMLQLERPDELVAPREIAKLELDREIAERELDYLEERGRLLARADEAELSMLLEQAERASGRIRELEDAIERMTLRAPRDGTVIHVANRRGERTRVGETVWRRAKVVAVPDLSEMRAQASVDEADSGRLRLGQRAELRLDALPEIVYRGTVSKLGRTVTRLSWRSPIRVLRVEIELDETDVTRMRPDMRFRGRIEVGRARNVLQVPIEAVRVGATDGNGSEPQYSVVARRGGAGRAALVPVSLGARNERVVEVRDGLQEGDEVSLSPDSVPP